MVAVLVLGGYETTHLLILDSDTATSPVQVYITSPSIHGSLDVDNKQRDSFLLCLSPLPEERLMRIEQASLLQGTCL